MEDAVGLMDLPVHREAQDDAGGPRLDDLDVEKLVDALAAVGQRERCHRREIEGGVVTAGC